jgi:hypothetical protein
VEYTWDRGERLTWSNVSAHLEEGCQDAIQYVNEISESEDVTGTEENTTLPTPDPSEGEYPEDSLEEEWDEEELDDEEEEYWDEWEDGASYP